MSSVGEYGVAADDGRGLVLVGLSIYGVDGEGEDGMVATVLVVSRDCFCAS
eukprot:CAMPEP_0197066502 /NCGR_PEP_ID=MMETSP1384-20130603/174023_1 /TAXON_ID=29189 /ORGANISM="Ammonia sp." /LENGTH=50 /DNA_ID=CAMNT_0042503665 /DNA_START=74 /DNA_END=222 /DNA_ORIENTATION=-